MKDLFIVANWKSNKTIQETEKWLHDFHEEFNQNPFSLDNKEIIISPSFTLLEHANYCSGNLKLPLKFAGQNISPFDSGAYTGEVNGNQIKEFADYVIIGHSERRSNFYESDEMISKKVDLAQKYKLTPILCVSNVSQIHNSSFIIHNSNPIVAYEPLFAIGTGNPDTPENAESVSRKIKEVVGNIPVLYGGSVTSKNVKSFTSMPNIDGVLVGNASLNPQKFLEIVGHA